MHLVQIQNVSKQYANHKALDNVSLDIPKHSIFGLLGPNGAGKTSLIRIINQITAPDSGRVLFDGEDLKLTHIERIGYLPEERGLYKKMEVGEQVLFLAKLKGLSSAEANKRVKMWFEKFELQSWWKKKIEELSKGMQQKVQFITTVVHEPDLIILDEPFSGFDPLNAQLIRDEILELRKKGSTIIFSTHRMDTVEDLCDNVALINKSKKVLDGAKNDIKQQFKDNSYLVRFVGALPNIQSFAQVIEERSNEDGSKECRIKLFEPGFRKESIRLFNDQTDLLGFEELIPDFNEIFIKTVKASENE
jgi:ABC-2 type transport system ATP-binding protein